jgi:hypothetical protein
VSWPWIVLLAAAVVLVAAVEWPRVAAALGVEGRRRRERERRKAALHVVRDPDPDDFAASVRRDLDQLPTIEERDRT